MAKPWLSSYERGVPPTLSYPNQTLNDLFLNAVGYSREEVVGQHHAMFVDPTERQGADYKDFWRQLANGTARQAQFLRFAKGGRRLWLQAIYMPITDRAGRTIKVVKFATDVTAQTQRAIELDGQIAALNRSQAVIAFRPDGTILDANLTGLIVGVALFAFGTGPLKGFALTMIIGIFASMFTAITVSRALATLIYGRRKKLQNVAI